MGAVLVHAPRSRRSLVQGVGLAGLVLLLLAVAAIKLATVPGVVYAQSSAQAGDQVTWVSFDLPQIPADRVNASE